jgi:hypothetical protein
MFVSLHPLLQFPIMLEIRIRIKGCESRGQLQVACPAHFPNFLLLRACMPHMANDDIAKVKYINKYILYLIFIMQYILFRSNTDFSVVPIIGTPPQAVFVFFF